MNIPLHVSALLCHLQGGNFRMLKTILPSQILQQTLEIKTKLYYYYLYIYIYRAEDGNS